MSENGTREAVEAFVTSPEGLAKMREIADLIEFARRQMIEMTAIDHRLLGVPMDV